jgi:hypothetical protein
MNIFQQAWDELWAGCLVRRASGYAWKGSDGHYLTASDLADKVRELSTGKTWYSGRAGGQWLNAARDWLHREVNAGRLQSHNFGRGHISGERFRPAGEAVTETELKTIKDREARKGRPKPCHYSQHGYGGRALCVKLRSGYWGHRSTAWTTKDLEKVTCPRCKNLLTGATVRTA